ncbi:MULTISPECIES: GNAT family N-acetyltransferase [unclassified Nostoc]|uniref:GNAT family N-acetyltransferase n=1 Tax=unclassified Nostoc TaxID=2593658 RepID=UPI002AD40522|nr:GNAT family N-acetyltransferase [Nostoc sp. DedQUE03]MDZ7970989.1 GNAT family N-acetyltransferase [Nostoc sp. DedQUE03]MDZ8046834.1 GNAT family N-acetyltransferase [Nostoc sp. DedQUE02]
MDYSIRRLTQEDEPFLWQMLYEAAHLLEEGNLTVQDAKNNPDLAKYVKNWGYYKDDTGFVATLKSSNQPVGAAWLRLLTGENKGYGYVSDRIPELAIAVLPQHRNQGIGTHLLTHLLAAAKTAYPSISLSTRATNPALSLYKRFGFEVVPDSEIINRVGGMSLKMKIDF